jgi:hypothetical protein
VALEDAIADGRVGDIVAALHGNGVDLRRALLMLTEAETRAAREQCFVTVSALLANLGVTF